MGTGQGTRLEMRTQDSNLDSMLENVSGILVSSTCLNSPSMILHGTTCLRVPQPPRLLRMPDPGQPQSRAWSEEVRTHSLVLLPFSTPQGPLHLHLQTLT